MLSLAMKSFDDEVWSSKPPSEFVLCRVEANLCDPFHRATVKGCEIHYWGTDGWASGLKNKIV